MARNVKGGFGGTVSVAAQGRSAYIAWADADSNNGDIFFRRVRGNGATLDAVLRLSTAASASMDPAVAVFGRAVYVAWSEWLNPAKTSDLSGQIWLRRSLDGGVTWQETQVIGLTSRSWDGAVNLLAQGADVYLAYVTDGDLFLVRSINRGRAWPGPVNVSQTADNSYAPDLATSADGLFIAYQEIYDAGSQERMGIFVRPSGDGGRNWSGATLVSRTTANGFTPAIAVGDQGAAIVFWERTDGDAADRVAAVPSADVTTWGVPRVISGKDAVANFLPDLAPGPGGFHAVWALEEGVIRYTTSAGGRGWRRPVDAASVPENADPAALAAGSSRLFLAFPGGDPRGVFFRTITP